MSLRSAPSIKAFRRFPLGGEKQGIFLLGFSHGSRPRVSKHVNPVIDGHSGDVETLCEARRVPPTPGPGVAARLAVSRLIGGMEMSRRFEPPSPEVTYATAPRPLMESGAAFSRGPGGVRQSHADPG